MQHERFDVAGQMMNADGFATMMGSWGFILIQSAILAVWVIWNVIAGLHNQRHPESHWFLWDEYPFIFLNLALSFQAAYAAPIIMMSQNRAASKDRLAVDIDHQVNVKSEVEINLIMRRLDDLERGMHFNHQEQCNLLRGDGNGRGTAADGRVRRSLGGGRTRLSPGETQARAP